MPGLQQALATATSETPMSWANLTMGICHTFSNSSATVTLTNAYMQSFTDGDFSHKTDYPYFSPHKNAGS